MKFIGNLDCWEVLEGVVDQQWLVRIFKHANETETRWNLSVSYLGENNYYSIFNFDSLVKKLEREGPGETYQVIGEEELYEERNTLEEILEVLNNFLREKDR
jgi:hypothetical protein